MNEFVESLMALWQDHISKVMLEVSVLRRLLFAAAYVPEGTPNCWNIISEFAFQHCTKRPCTATDVRLLLENIEILDGKAFANDTSLMKEIDAVKRCKGQSSFLPTAPA